MGGYIKLYRKLTDCWVWEEPDKLKAWLDLIMMANYRDKQVRVGNDILTVKRGQVFTSELKLSKRWHWSRDKVRRFLCALNETAMTTTDKTAIGTLITLVKYDFYQGGDTADDTTLDTPDKTADDTTVDTAHDTTDETQHKKEKNLKNINNKNIKEKHSLTGVQKEKHPHGEYANVKLTDDEYRKMVDEHGLEDTEAAVKILDEYIEETGKKYKSHYLTMKRWAFAAVEERKRKPPGKIVNIHGFDMDPEQRKEYRDVIDWGY